MSSQRFLTVPPTDPETHPSLEHVAIWAEDVGRSAKFLEDALGWKLHPMVFGVPDDNPVYGGMDLRFVDGNGLWLELVQPMTEGPGMEFMKEKGNGAIVELDFFVNDFDRNFEQMKARGIDLVGMDGKPMVGGGLLQEYVVVDGKRVIADERLSYLPFELTRGTSIELAWEYPNGAVYVRDAQWNAAVATPKDTPRLDSVVVLAEDLESTAKIYGDILRLPRHASGKGLRRPWLGVGDDGHAWFVCSASGFWLELASPDKSATGQAAVGKFGDGNIMELAAEVPDIEAFCRRMNAKGFTMTAGDGVPLPPGQAAMTVEGTGDRFAYFPLDRSEGMRIRVFQRGPAATSVYHLRDRK